MDELCVALHPVGAGQYARRLSPPLPGPPFDRLLTVSRQLLYWYGLEDRRACDARSPVYIWMYGKTANDYVYGFPPLPGDPRVKVAKEPYVTTTTAADRAVSPDDTARMYRDTVARCVTVVSACSAHGFKHPAGIGLTLAELCADGCSRIDIKPARP